MVCCLGRHGQSANALCACADGSLQSDPLLTPDANMAYSGGSMNATFVEDPDTFGRTLECSKVPHRNRPNPALFHAQEEHCLVFMPWSFASFSWLVFLFFFFFSFLPLFCFSTLWPCMAAPHPVPGFMMSPVRGQRAPLAGV